MFDTFKPLQRLKKQPFSFQSKRYEIWMKGQMIKNGSTNSRIVSCITYEDEKEVVQIDYNDPSLFNELAQQVIFDEFITSSDRLQLITIPQETNSENMGIISFRMALGCTRIMKDFVANEPYCCNLFLQNGILVKVTFSFSSPEKLVEFYSDDNIDYTPNNNPIKDLF